MKRIFVALAMLTFGSSAAIANELEHPETARCIAIAADRFNVPEAALWLILDVERGTVGRVSQNTNGTVDIGPMQINSWWTAPERLGRFGISYNDILHDRCLNIYVGAWIFAQEYQRERDVVKAIARYHSPTPEHQHRYLGLIQKAIQRKARRLEREASRDVAYLPPVSVSIPLNEHRGNEKPETIRAPVLVAARNRNGG